MGRKAGSENPIVDPQVRFEFPYSLELSLCLIAMGLVLV